MQSIIITALVTVGLCIAGGVAYGQTFSEWWLQKKTRIKYLHQQIAALEELRKLWRDGYEMAEGRVDSVETLTEEELDMHWEFFLNLQFVKPPLKDSAEVISSYALVATLAQRVRESMDSYLQDPSFTKEDIEWTGAYLKDNIQDIRSDLRELDELTTDGALEMTDDERYKRIRAVEQTIREKYRGGITFLLQMHDLLELERQQQVNEAFVRDRL